MTGKSEKGRALAPGPFEYPPLTYFSPDASGTDTEGMRKWREVSQLLPIVWV